MTEYNMAGGPVGPANSNGSSVMGSAGVGLQIGGTLISGYAGIQQANADIDTANQNLAMTERQVFDTYTQLFEDLGENNRRLYAAQNVAVATSGLAAEGSVKDVLREAVKQAGVKTERMSRAMDSEIAAAQKRASDIRKQARRSKRYSAISTGLSLAAIGVGM